MERHDIRVEIAADPKMLHVVRGLVRGYIEQVGVAADRADDVVLAVDEACANSIRHAYQGQPDARLELTLGAGPDVVEIQVRDEGVPASRQALERKPLAPPDPANLRPGGLGVPLIYQVFDEVEFRVGDTRGNRVTMRLRRRQPAAAWQERNSTEGKD